MLAGNLHDQWDVSTVKIPHRPHYGDRKTLLEGTEVPNGERGIHVRRVDRHHAAHVRRIAERLEGLMRMRMWNTRGLFTFFVESKPTNTSQRLLYKKTRGRKPLQFLEERPQKTLSQLTRAHTTQKTQGKTMLRQLSSKCEKVSKYTSVCTGNSRSLVETAQRPRRVWPRRVGRSARIPCLRGHILQPVERNVRGDMS